MLPDKKLLQRIALAFTTGLFLACAARVSAVSAASVPPAPTAIVR